MFVVIRAVPQHGSCTSFREFDDTHHDQNAPKDFVKNYEGNQYQILNRYMNLLALNYLNYENVRQPLKDQKYYYEKLEKFYKEWHSVPGKKDFKRFKKLAVICMILHLEMTK